MKEKNILCDYDLLLLTYTDNVAPAQPRSVSTNPRFGNYYEKMINSSNYGDLTIKRFAPSHDAVQILKKANIPLDHAMRIIE